MGRKFPQTNDLSLPLEILDIKSWGMWSEKTLTISKVGLYSKNVTSDESKSSLLLALSGESKQFLAGDPICTIFWFWCECY